MDEREYILGGLVSTPETMILVYTNANGASSLWVDFGIAEDGVWTVYVAVTTKWRTNEFPNGILARASSWYIDADQFPYLWRTYLMGFREQER